ncbi:hypothetical protein N303_14440, partial [Cuculus canorus]
PGLGRTPRWPCAVVTVACQGPVKERGMSGFCKQPLRTSRVTPSPPPSSSPPPQQGELHTAAHQLAEERQQRHLVGGDPVLDAEDVSVDHAVRHHRVEVEALMYARHGGAR